MAHPPLTVCLFCERPLEPNEPAVFRGKGKLGHIRCWRPDPPAKRPDTSGLPPTGPCEPAGFRPSAGRRRARSRAGSP
jgi:hypothetical protein